jgi:chromosome segregation protein
MHLKAITMKGFKSFPDRTSLTFGPGVSVVVGPNGSGKSNITDAVLWALGEQSPLAVRGQTMQDVIFAGGHGVKSRSAAEVEVVIDNSDGLLDTDFAEISIARRVDRSGEGVYLLNGARCRLVDVVEVLSDTGLGKEMHSVISQGRVESIIHSKPGDRTALIEEAAGLTKHRKRRHRAQLKLNRTQDNLDRALDVEREARSRLRPLKRQAEAAELHARLERQSLEARATLLGDDLRAVRAELGEAERTAAAARAQRDGIEERLMEVARTREATEHRFAEHGRERELLSGRMFGAGAAVDRISLRVESAAASAEALRERAERSLRMLDSLRASGEAGAELPQGTLGELEAELERLDAERAARLGDELAGLESQRAEAERRQAELGSGVTAVERELERLAEDVAAVRERRRAAEEAAHAAARAHSAAAVECERLRERLRLSGHERGDALVARLDVEPGYEAALAAALGGLLSAAVVGTVAEGERAIEAAGDEGARALVRGRTPRGEATTAPGPAAERLLDRVRPAAEVSDVAQALLADAWVVDSLTALPPGFSGVAVTRGGVAYDARRGEVRRLPAGGGEQDLAERGRLADLESQVEAATRELDEAREAVTRDAAAAAALEETREGLEARQRDARRAEQEAEEEARRCAWLADQRRERGGGPEAARRAELEAQIAAERHVADRLAAERARHAARVTALERSLERDRAALPHAERLLAAMQAALAEVSRWRTRLEQELSADEAQGEGVAGELRELARREYELQGKLREASELLTQEEVRVAHVRDREQAVAGEASQVAGRLGLEPQAAVATEPLEAAERDEVEARLERLERRRERLGPVNPLAAREYEEALEHVEELEAQRTDLEEALAELRRLIRETDRRIRESFEETFEAARRNFEDVIERLFPGGSGRLRRVSAPRPQPVLGGTEDEESAHASFGSEAATAQGGPEHAEPGSAEQGSAGQGSAEPEADLSGALAPESQSFDLDSPGIEIEVTPAGKTTKRLSLLSGGEKSLVALAFMFAVFLARPCPFYILDEVEAALDDTNIDRFLSLVRAYSDRAQFIVITHQRRTMEAADVLYGVSMGGDGVSKVVSRRLEAETEAAAEAAAA